MRICKVYLSDNGAPFRFPQEFELGRFTVLFGKNNAGKTTVLDYIYLMLATRAPGANEPLRGYESGGSLEDQIGARLGAVYVELDPGLEFDHAVLESFPRWEPVEEGVVRFGPLPPRQVCYASEDRDRPELWYRDVSDFYEGIYQEILDAPGNEPGPDYELDEQQRSDEGPFPQPLMLGWEFHEMDEWVTAAIDRLTEARGRRSSALGLERSWWEWIESDDQEESAFRVRPAVHRAVEQLAALATDLLPDFLDGEVRAILVMPHRWDDRPQVMLTYHERGLRRSAVQPRDCGRGASRWIGIAVQVALRIMEGGDEVTSLDAAGSGAFSGHVLFVDEPEAHLHYSAVASVVRWCMRLVDSGFNVIAASHHEEFLRTSGEEVTFVKVTRVLNAAVGELATAARTIPVIATSTLQELADEIGLHPAAALSLQRAILFVEGPLDEAVLDEFAGGALDAAGVSIIPIHGTKNLEGLIDGEFTARLGIRTAVLTDNTHVATMRDRSNRKRSSQEVKLVRLIRRFEEQGLPAPTPFGVAEEDLLFALPVEAIRDFLDGPFPEWSALVAECRKASGRGPSDSVDWKTFALEHYGLPITTTDGVRRIVRALDLAGVELPSVSAAVAEIIAWANDAT